MFLFSKMNCQITICTYLWIYLLFLGLALSGMPHVTDGLWNSIFSKLKQARILVMGTTDRMSAKIHVDHLVDAMSKNCPHLERLEFRFVLTSEN